MTSHHTAALRDCLAHHSSTALTEVVHALACAVLFPFEGDISCLQVGLRIRPLTSPAPEIDDTPAMITIAKRHESWQQRMPEDAGMWDFVAALDLEQQMELLVHCASLGIDAVCDRVSERAEHADTLVRSIGLDMAAYWMVTQETYLARVSKDRILDAAREGVGKEAAETSPS